MLTQTLSYLPLGLAIILAIADWIAVYQNRRRAETVLKPAVMLAILTWLGVNAGFSGSLIWFAMGILLLLAGDILMLPAVNLSMAGRFAYGAAHSLYIIGFNPSRPPLNFATLAMAILVGMVIAMCYRIIASKRDWAANKRLLYGILTYLVILGVMTFSALATLGRSEWQVWSSLLVSAGAILVMLSDILHLLKRFATQSVASIQYDRVIVMATYHVGQILIILGVGMHYHS